METIGGSDNSIMNWVLVAVEGKTLEAVGPEEVEWGRRTSCGPM